MLTSVILGAGFSYVAGLPLAKDLITARVFIPSGSFEKDEQVFYKHGKNGEKKIQMVVLNSFFQNYINSINYLL